MSYNPVKRLGGELVRVALVSIYDCVPRGITSHRIRLID
jgi:hypothetical protein